MIKKKLNDILANHHIYMADLVAVKLEKGGYYIHKIKEPIKNKVVSNADFKLKLAKCYSPLVLNDSYVNIDEELEFEKRYASEIALNCSKEVLKTALENCRDRSIDTNMTIMDFIRKNAINRGNEISFEIRSKEKEIKKRPKDIINDFLDLDKDKFR
jgi:hypothetical protein